MSATSTPTVCLSVDANEWVVINTAILWQLCDLHSVCFYHRYYTAWWASGLGCSRRPCQPDSHRHGHHQDQVNKKFEPIYSMHEGLICSKRFYWWCMLHLWIVYVWLPLLITGFLSAWAVCSVIPRSRFESVLDSEPESFSSILRSPSHRASQ